MPSEKIALAMQARWIVPVGNLGYIEIAIPAGNVATATIRFVDDESSLSVADISISELSELAMNAQAAVNTLRA